jgi:hypothetical protein
MSGTFRVAFYKGTRPGIPGLYNRLVRARGRGKYSHVEMQFSDGMSASSSFEDGGTRFKRIGYSSGDWDFIDLPAEWEPCARQWFRMAAATNRGYDILGNVHIAFGFLEDSPTKHFCSEAVAKALQIEEAFRLEPNALYTVLKRLVEVYWEARASRPELLFSVA